MTGGPHWGLLLLVCLRFCLLVFVFVLVAVDLGGGNGGRQWFCLLLLLLLFWGSIVVVVVESSSLSFRCCCCNITLKSFQPLVLLTNDSERKCLRIVVVAVAL